MQITCWLCVLFVCRNCISQWGNPFLFRLLFFVVGFVFFICYEATADTSLSSPSFAQQLFECSQSKWKSSFSFLSHWKKKMLYVQWQENHQLQSVKSHSSVTHCRSGDSTLAEELDGTKWLGEEKSSLQVKHCLIILFFGICLLASMSSIKYKELNSDKSSRRKYNIRKNARPGWPLRCGYRERRGVKRYENVSHKKLDMSCASFLKIET